MYTCIIEGCNNPVGAQNEVDVQVAIVVSNEPRICSDCYASDKQEIKDQITKALARYYNKDIELPF